MAKKKIFLSAVTGQFKACRDTLRCDLAAVGAEVVVQEDFTMHGGTLLEKLEEYISSCDLIIALVGSAYGWEPESGAQPQGRPARSYTQWEYYFARGERLAGTQALPAEPIPVYLYFASPGYLEEHTVQQSAAATKRQEAFIAEILASGKDRSEFDSIDKLGRLVLRDGFKLQDSGKYLLHNLPYDSMGSLFKGRDEIIDDIRAKLTADAGEATTIVAKLAIHGLGGIGKTRLGVEYAWRCLADYSACLFVIADSAENLDRNLAALCGPRILNLPEQAEPQQELQVAAVLRWFNLHSDWLLILDNVDSAEAAKAVDKLLPSLQGGQVLITSRRTDWDDSIRTLPLDTLADGDGVAFLGEKTMAHRTHTDTDAEDALALVSTLGGLALAIEQAGAFINKKRLSLAEYRVRWDQQEIKLRHFPVKHYPRSLAVTWETSFEQLSSNAQALLNLLCWFSSDPIPRGPIKRVFGEVGGDLLAPLLKDSDLEDHTPDEAADLEDLLEELETLSLLKWESGNDGFSVHRLVQEITRTRLTSKLRKVSLQAATDLVAKARPAEQPRDVRSWIFWEPIRPHVEQLVRMADAAGITDPTALLMNEFGLFLQAKGVMNEAEPLMQRALEIDEASYGSDHPNIAIHLNNLVSLLIATKRLKEAEPLIRRALEIDEASYGSEHPDVAIDINNLASLLQTTNRLEEAEPLFRRALAIDESSYGNDHPNVAIHLGNLASLLKATNRQEEAEPLMRRVLKIDEESYGSDHPNVAIRLNNLAQLLKDTNRLEEAEPLMRRALEIDEKSYGSKHPNVAIRLNNLALLFQTTNRLEGAEPLMRRSAEILLLFSMRTGYNHPRVKTVLSNYEALLTEIGYDSKKQQEIIEEIITTVKANSPS